MKNIWIEKKSDKCRRQARTDFYDLVGEKSKRRKVNLLIRSDDEDVVQYSDFY